MLQGVVQNPFLGEGLVAGFNTSGNDHRPGFAWFFGRDAEWTSLALDAEGDFPTARNALEFLSKYQRADGKIPHEISQSASFTDWFKSTPYAYASADATPLFIIAVERLCDTQRGHWIRSAEMGQPLESLRISPVHQRRAGTGAELRAWAPAGSRADRSIPCGLNFTRHRWALKLHARFPPRSSPG